VGPHAGRHLALGGPSWSVNTGPGLFIGFKARRAAPEPEGLQLGSRVLGVGPHAEWSPSR